MQTYDPAKLVIVFGGFPISGYAEGTFVNVARDADAFSKNVGSGGSVARAKSNNKSGSVTITLQQTSLSNDYLSGVAIADDIGGTGILPLIVKDLEGTTLYESAHAWIRKVADGDFSNEIEGREWVIDCEVLEMVTGGTPMFGLIPQ